MSIKCHKQIETNNTAPHTNRNYQITFASLWAGGSNVARYVTHRALNANTPPSPVLVNITNSTPSCASIKTNVQHRRYAVALLLCISSLLCMLVASAQIIMCFSRTQENTHRKTHPHNQTHTDPAHIFHDVFLRARVCVMISFWIHFIILSADFRIPRCRRRRHRRRRCRCRRQPPLHPHALVSSCECILVLPVLCWYCALDIWSTGSSTSRSVGQDLVEFVFD